MSLELIAHRLNTVVEAQERIEREQSHLSEAFHAVEVSVVQRVVVVEERVKSNFVKAILGAVVALLTSIAGTIIAVFGR